MQYSYLALKALVVLHGLFLVDAAAVDLAATSPATPSIFARDARSNTVVAVDQAGGPHGDDSVKPPNPVSTGRNESTTDKCSGMTAPSSMEPRSVLARSTCGATRPTMVNFRL